MMFDALCDGVAVVAKGSAQRFEQAARMAGRLGGKIDSRRSRDRLRKAADEVGIEPDMAEMILDREFERGRKEGANGHDKHRANGGGNGVHAPVIEGQGVVHFPLKPVRASSLAGRTPPPRQYLDGHELFLARRLNLLTGGGAVGKSLLGLQLACALALPLKLYPETSWLGLPVRERGKVLVLTTEDDIDEVHRRLIDIAAEGGFDIAHLHDLTIIDMVGNSERSMCIGTRGGGIKQTAVFGEFERLVAHGGYSTVVLDNRAQLVDVDEINRSAATKISAILDGFARFMQTTVILLAHPSLAGIANRTGASGSTGWLNAVRNQVDMRRPVAEEGAGIADDGKRELVPLKSNYGPMGRVINLQWELGCYRCADKPERAGADIGKTDRAERVFMKLMEAYERRGIELSANANSHTSYAPLLFSKDSAREGVNKRQFEHAMMALLDAGKIEITINNQGKYREKRYLRAKR